MRLCCGALAFSSLLVFQIQVDPQIGGGSVKACAVWLDVAGNTLSLLLYVCAVPCAAANVTRFFPGFSFAST